MQVYVLMTNRLPIDDITVYRTIGFPTDGTRLRELCKVEDISLGNTHPFAITYVDFLHANNTGYAIGDIPLVIFGGHASIEETLGGNIAIPLTSQNGQNLSVAIVSEDEGIALGKAAALWAVAPIAAAKRAAREPTAIGKVTKFFDVATKIQETVTRASKKFTYVIVYGGQNPPNATSLNAAATDTQNLYMTLTGLRGWH